MAFLIDRGQFKKPLGALRTALLKAFNELAGNINTRAATQGRPYEFAPKEHNIFTDRKKSIVCL